MHLVTWTLDPRPGLASREQARLACAPTPCATTATRRPAPSWWQAAGRCKQASTARTHTRLLARARHRGPRGGAATVRRCCVGRTHTSFIIFGNKGRLPASGLGVKRPEQHAHLQARLLGLYHYSLFSHSLTRFLLSSPPSSRSSITIKVSPRLHLSITLSPLFLLPSFCLAWKNKNSTGMLHRSPSSTGSFSTRSPPLGPHIISSSSASSSPSASSVCLFH